MSKEKQDIIINGLTRLHNTHANSDNQTIGHSKLDLINTKLSTLIDFSGQPNNAGDGSNMMKQLNYGYDYTSAMRPIRIDTDGKLETSSADVETKLDTLETTLSNIETDIAALEVLQTTTNTKLETHNDYAGQPNAVGDGSNMQRKMIYGYDYTSQQRPIRVDTDGKLVTSGGGGGGSDTTAANQVLLLAQATLTNSMRIRQKNIEGKCFAAWIDWQEVNHGTTNSVSMSPYYNQLSIFNPTGSGVKLYVYHVCLPTKTYSNFTHIVPITVAGKDTGTFSEDLVAAGKITNMNTSSSATTSAEVMANPDLAYNEEIDERCFFMDMNYSSGDTTRTDYLEDHIIIGENTGIMVKIDPHNTTNHVIGVLVKWYEE